MYLPVCPRGLNFQGLCARLPFSPWKVISFSTARHRLAVALPELGLVVPGIEMADRAGAEDVQDSLGLGGKMRRFGRERIDGLKTGRVGNSTCLDRHRYRRPADHPGRAVQTARSRPCQWPDATESRGGPAGGGPGVAADRSAMLISPLQVIIAHRKVPSLDARSMSLTGGKTGLRMHVLMMIGVMRGAVSLARPIGGSPRCCPQSSGRSKVVRIAIVLSEYFGVFEMSAVQQIEEAVRRLSDEERAAFRAWFAEFDAAEWDRQFEFDVKAGRLDWLIHEGATRSA